MNNKLKVSVGVLLVFVLGILAGSLGTQAYMKYRVSHFMSRGHEARTELLLKRLSRDLDLTETQKAEIKKILRDSQKTLAEIGQRCRPQIGRIIENHFAMIREILNDDQKQKLDEFYKRFRKQGKHGLFRSLPPPSHN
ncbi:MAG: hypothetical protein KAT81_03845 [Syntrophobacterales bacterium]|nr:hypothetical protein [Syntrophobacterales bacterium]